MEYLMIFILIVVGAVAGMTLAALRKTSLAQKEKDQKIENLLSPLGTTLHQITTQMNGITVSVAEAMGSSTRAILDSSGQVGTRMDAAARAIGEVQNRLGALGEATDNLKELGTSVASLQQLLSAPKLRGGLGEELLADLLGQVLPPENFELQHRFKSGNAVDALITTSGGTIPVDSKFPLENFRKAIQAKSDQDRRTAARTFISDVKTHIDAIASKYILPDEGTFPFAIMYIPAEAVYYEIAVREDELGLDNAGALVEYALAKKVILTSPATFYAYLHAIAYGLKGLRIEKRTQHVMDTLSRARADLERLGATLGVITNHLKNAAQKQDEGSKQLETIQRRLETASDGGDHA